jgi:uncharacterized membrane protein YeaQ/YmgE (transglycosylase-associated protein family)
MHVIWVVVVGLVVGGLAKLVMPGRDPGGILVTIALGLAGSVLADLIGRSAGGSQPNEGAGFIASIVGAVILLVGYRAIVSRGAAR